MWRTAISTVDEGLEVVSPKSKHRVHLGPAAPAAGYAGIGLVALVAGSAAFGAWLFDEGRVWIVVAATFGVTGAYLCLSAAFDVLVPDVRRRTRHVEQHGPVRIRVTLVAAMLLGTVALAIVVSQQSLYHADPVAWANQLRSILVALVLSGVAVRTGVYPGKPHHHAPRIALVAAGAMLTLGAVVPHVSPAAAIMETIAGCVAMFGALLLRMASDRP